MMTRSPQHRHRETALPFVAGASPPVAARMRRIVQEPAAGREEVHGHRAAVPLRARRAELPHPGGQSDP
jgi:hypothetical protein